MLLFQILESNLCLPTSKIYGSWAVPLGDHILKSQAIYKVGELMCCWAWKGADQQEQLLTAVGSRSLMGLELCATKWHKPVLCLEWCCYRGGSGLRKALALRTSHTFVCSALGNCQLGWELSCTEQAADKGNLSTHTHSLFQVVLAGSEQKWLNKQLHIPAQKSKR